MSKFQYAVGDRVRRLYTSDTYTIAAREGNHFWLRGPGPTYTSVAIHDIVWEGDPEPEQPPPSTEIKVGDKVRIKPGYGHTEHVYEVLAIDEGRAWIKRIADHDYSPFTISLAGLIPPSKPFLPDGDKYVAVKPNLNTTSASGLVSKDYIHMHNHVLRIDGQTGELSWEKGGPDG